MALNLNVLLYFGGDMRNKLLCLFLNVALLIGTPTVMFLVLVGVDMVFEIKTLWGFVFMMFGLGWVCSCGVAMAINIKAAFK